MTLTVPVVRRLWPELVGLFSLGLPIIFTQLLQVSQGTIAVIMMGRVGSRELAAVGLGASLWVFVWLGCMGLLMGLAPTIAQHHGGYIKVKSRPGAETSFITYLPTSSASLDARVYSDGDEMGSPGNR